MFNFPILLLLLICSLKENILANNAQIFELTSESMSQTEQGLWLLEFYATWCSHCRHLEPVYQEVAGVLNQLQPAVKVAKIDAPRNPQAASQFGVRGYPTLIFLKDGVKYTYNEERTTKQIVQFVSRICGPAVISLPNDDALSVHNDQVFFFYTGSSHGELWNAFNVIAEEKKIQLSFFEVKNSLKNQSPEAVFVHKDGFELAFHPPEGALSADLESNLRVWVETERHQAYPELTALGIRQLEAEISAARRKTESEEVRRKMAKTLVVFIVGDNEASYKFKAIGKALSLDSASPLLESFKFAWTSDIIGVSHLAMTTLQTPNLFLYGPDEEIILHPKYAYENGLRDLSRQSLVAFLSDVAADRVASYGGAGFVAQLRRFFYEMITGSLEFMVTSPLLALVVFGLPLACFSCFCYCVFCNSFEDDDEDVSLVREQWQRKEGEMNYTSTTPIDSGDNPVNSRPRSKLNPTVIGPVPSREDIALRRSIYLESKKYR